MCNNSLLILILILILIPSCLSARLSSRRRRKESLIKALFSRKFETPYVVSYGNELFFNDPPSMEVDHE
jgi:hypothetical protein